MDVKNLQQILNQSYNRENWKQIVQFVFPNVSIFEKPIEFPIENDKIKRFAQLGNVRLSDGKNLALFELTLADDVNLQRNRVELNSEVSKYIDQEQIHGVLSVFEQGREDYRFTFSARSTEFDEEESDFVTKKTDTKRFTYVLGQNESCKTAAKRFFELSENKDSADIEAIQKAFSVEKLSKEFFDKYKSQFEKFWRYINTNDEYRKLFLDNDKEKQIRDFTKKLLGRIVFLHFLQKKGWMGCDAQNAGWENGNKQFMQKLFADFAEKDTFHSKCLHQLFFNTLNNNKRDNFIFECDGVSAELNGTKIPYLNGGLFDADKEISAQIDFPQAYFTELFDLFSQYNFTIDENDPNDHEVGIDPEMLGHIFENLLEDNKDKGAFYTPKIIVQYMCQESLIEYLATKLNAEPYSELKIAIEDLVRNRLAQGINDLDQVDAIAQALHQVKICDPAIGSGAFPMGILNEIFKIIEDLYFLQPDAVSEVWNIDSQNWQPHLVKKSIIQNSIYGVDLESGAVDIARLRFWLALIVDETEPLPLPNLDYKIMQGNSLLESYEGIDLSQIADSKAYEEFTADAQIDIFTGEAKKKVKTSVKVEDIQQLMQEYFSTSEPEKKKEIHEKIDEQVFNHIKYQINKHKKGLKKNIEILEAKVQKDANAAKTEEQKTKILTNSKAAKDLIKNKTELSEYINKDVELNRIIKSNDKPFFLWNLYFKDVFDQEGFDIVIGNPPYVSALNMKRSDNLKMIFKTEYPEVSGSYDLYILFLLLARKISNNKGFYTWIIPNKFLISDYSKKTLNVLKENGLYRSVNVSSVNVFKGVGVYPIIISGFSNIVKRQYKEFKVDRLTDIVNNKLIEVEEMINYPTIKSNELLINSGTTGFEAQKVKSLVTEESINNESIMFTVSGNIDRYKYNNMNVQFMKKRYTSAFINKTEEISDSKWNFWISPKIVIAGMTKVIEAVYVDNPLALGVGVYGIYDFKNFEPFSLTAILNSKYLSYYFKNKFKDKHLAGGYLAINKSTIEEFPIVEPNDKQVFILKNISKVLHKNIISEIGIINYLESIIDALVFELYFPKEFKEKGLAIEEKAGVLFTDIEGLLDEEKSAKINSIYEEYQKENNPLRLEIERMKVELADLLNPILSIY